MSVDTVLMCQNVMVKPVEMQSLISFGLDLRLLQGIIQRIYDETPALQSVESDLFRLRLNSPQLETRDIGDVYCVGLHLTGRVTIGSSDEQLFDTWVLLQPALTFDADGIPVGVLEYDRVVTATPFFVVGFVAQEFAPDGRVGVVLSTLQLPLFKPLLERVVEMQFPNSEGITSSILSSLSFDFYLGRPGFITRPNYTPYPVGRAKFEKRFNGTADLSTVPALVASVALNGQQARLPGDTSNVVHGSGMQLIVSKTLFDMQLAQQAASQIGTEISDGVDIDSLSLMSGDAGIDIDMRGSKTGVTVKIKGTIMGQFYGGTGGSLVMVPAVDVDVDTDWWVDLLSAIAIAVPVVGWILGDIFIWDPLEDAREEAPITANESLSKQFNEALVPVATAVTESLEIEDLESRAYLSDVWFFNGHFTVAAAAFAGVHFETITAVSHDVAYVGSHKDHLKPVPSVREISLSQGHVLKPWQAGELAKLGIVVIPLHHGVENHLARGDYYLRSNPNDTVADNLVPNISD